LHAVVIRKQDFHSTCSLARANASTLSFILIGHSHFFTMSWRIAVAEACARLCAAMQSALGARLDPAVFRATEFIVAIRSIANRLK